jgi:predicted HAD superfamily Cof-like phosphohydrolase
MADVFNDQRKFMTVSGQTVNEHNQSQFELYKRLIQEEVSELAESKSVTDELDALIDIMVVTAGAIHSMGVDAEGAWKEVYRSNMAKVDPATGKVRKREDGKVLKPANWEPPRLERYIRPRAWDNYSDLPAPEAYRD